MWSVLGSSGPVPVFCELQALLKKDAPTLAHAMRQVVNYVAAAAQRGRAPGSRLKVVHLVTGDGVPTNMAAARRLFQSFRGDPLIDYHLLVWQCASHQTNLVVQVAICGRLLADPLNANALCVTCSRLFKYLINDYFEEFSASLRVYVSEACELVEANEADLKQHRKRVADLVALYGPEVLPEELLQLYNVSLSAPRCSWQAEGEPDIRDLRGQVFLALQKRILRVEEHPIVTRFWLFGSCVCTLLLIHLFNVPIKIFTVQSIRPQVKQQKRLDAVRAYWNRQETPAELRIAVLCLRLTSISLNIVSRQREKGPGAVLAALAKGEVQQQSGLLCASLLQNILRDPELPQERALEAVLTTMGHLVARFARYQEYPTKLWALCRTLNETGWVDACVDFLHAPDCTLDAGYSLLLKREAWDGNGEADAISFLMSDMVQRELEAIFVHAHATSLDVERKIAQDKKMSVQDS